MRQSEEKIYQIFGIPHSIASNAGAKGQNNFLQLFAMNGSIRQTKEQIERFLQETLDLHMITNETSSKKSNKKPVEKGTPAQTTTFLEKAPNATTNSHEPVANKHAAKPPLTKVQNPTVDGKQGLKRTRSDNPAQLGATGENNDDAASILESAQASAKEEVSSLRVVLPGIPCITFAEIFELASRGHITEEEV